MHDLEPFYRWRDHYCAEEDPCSPFYGKVYSEFEFSDAVYDHVIHPQWDNFGSSTLFIKILYADYVSGYAVIELMGEWNDCLHNDIMYLKRDVADLMMQEGIFKFIIIGENVLNFHSSDDCYYEEWFDDVFDQNGWIAMLNFRDHVMNEFKSLHIDQYFLTGDSLEEINWRTKTPDAFCESVENYVMKHIG